MDTLPTKERLANDLAAAGAPAALIAQARRGDFDEYQSTAATPIMDLVQACLATGLPALALLAEQAKRGAYDGTEAEGEDWYRRVGQDLLDRQEEDTP